MAQMDDNPCTQCLAVLLWSWGHGITNKAEALRGELGNLRSQLEMPFPDFRTMRAMLDEIEQITEELVGLPSPFIMDRVPVNSLIDKRVDDLKRRKPYDTIVFKLDLDSSEPVVKVNHIWLRRLLDILIDNAVDAMRESTNRQISISTIVSERRVRIIVEDTGTGIDHQLVPRLFEKPSVLQPGGKGRGIYVARLLVDIYNGRIELDKTDQTGTSIVVWLPLLN